MYICAANENVENIAHICPTTTIAEAGFGEKVENERMT
jgi:hypothetical protein